MGLKNCLQIDDQSKVCYLSTKVSCVLERQPFMNFMMTILSLNDDHTLYMHII